MLILRKVFGGDEIGRFASWTEAYDALEANHQDGWYDLIREGDGKIAEIKVCGEKITVDWGGDPSPDWGKVRRRCEDALRKASPEVIFRTAQDLGVKIYS